MTDDTNHPKASVKGYDAAIGNMLDMVQSAIYALVAIFLVAMALMSFYIVTLDLEQFVTAPASILVIDNALESLMIIFVITGLIQTLIEYLKAHTIDVRLIMAVGLTAVIRRVLVFGATPTPWDETALTAVLVFVLILGIYLIRRVKPENGI